MKAIKLGEINCPDWLDIPLMILIPLAYLLFVIGLAIVYSPWFLLLLVLVPTGRRDMKKKWQKHIAERIKKWKEMDSGS